MSEKLSLHFQYPATISDIVSLNDSFDSCKLSICYPGKNRNGSIIPKEAIEAALPSMAYCPVVTHYDIDKDTVGGHDMKVVKRPNGELKMVNLTNAIGVVPETPEYSWEEKDDGHSYLCTKALIWKRSAAYEILVENGITAQSMEIDVKTGHMSDDGYVIDSFAFTAFCVIGVDPCFENASVEFSAQAIDNELSEMLEDFKHEFSCVPTKVITASADDNINQSFPKGGETEMNIEELLAKFGLSAEDVAGIDMTGMDEQAVEARFAEIVEAKNQPAPAPEGDPAPADPTPDPEPAPATDPEPTADPQPAAFSLTMEQLADGLRNALRAHRVRDDYWGEMYSYYMIDCDMDANMVYAHDYAHNAILGMPYTLNGDNVVIDFESAKRMKIQFVEFDEGVAETAFSLVSDVLNDARVMCDQIIGERDELNQFKLNQIETERQAQVSAKLNEFADLEGNEMYELLRSENAGMTVDQIESRCFEIRGRMGAAKFALKSDNPVRIPVDRNTHSDDEPYGGIFAEYGIGNR